MEKKWEATTSADAHLISVVIMMCGHERAVCWCCGGVNVACVKSPDSGNCEEGLKDLQSCFTRLPNVFLGVSYIVQFLKALDNI